MPVLLAMATHHECCMYEKAQGAAGCISFSNAEALVASVPGQRRHCDA